MDTNAYIHGEQIAAARQDSGIAHHEGRVLADPIRSDVDIPRPSCIELGKNS